MARKNYTLEVVMADGTIRETAFADYGKAQEALFTETPKLQNGKARRVTLKNFIGEPRILSEEVA